MRPTKSSRTLILAGAVSLVGVVACRGGSDGDPWKTIYADAGSGGVAPPPAPEWPFIAGWKPYPDYDPACHFYVPEEGLPWLRWIPCIEGTEELPGPKGIVCRRSMFDDPGGLTERVTMGEVLSDGRVALLYSRTYGGARVATVVAEADGPVHHALLQGGTCAVGGRDIHEGQFVFRVLDGGLVQGSIAGGAIGGGVDDAAFRVFVPKGREPALEHSYSVGASGFVEERPHVDLRYAFAAADWVEEFLDPVAGGIEEPIEYGRYRFRGDDLFWIGTGYPRFEVNVRPHDGAGRTLLGQDGSVPVLFATDGLDMVWMGVDVVGEDWGGAPASIWTAKYTTDPAALAATSRRLRSDFSNEWHIFTWGAFAVGCGYAAHRTFDEENMRGGVRIVRLSDGFSWDLFTDWSKTPDVPIHFERPFAITCEEVFAEVIQRSGARDIARIRLDSLGEGNPPDRAPDANGHRR